MVCFAAHPPVLRTSPLRSNRPFMVRERTPAYGESVVDSSVPDPPAGADPAPRDPFEDVDALENLEEEIVVLAARIHAATHRLHYRTGIDLGAARGCTTSELERLIRAYRIGSRATEKELEQRRHESRRFSVFPGGDGMYVVRGRLDPEVGALLMRAVEASSDALFRESSGPWEPEAERSGKAARLRADAVGLLAERAMAAGFGEEEAPISGTRAERYQVVLHVEEEGGVLEDGTRISAETSRRMCCDTGVVTIKHSPGDLPGPGHLPGSDGSILAVGRRTRTISPALRRALEARDAGCRFPGCGLRFTDAHHVKHWADGGETSLSNTLLLCKHHHVLVHEGGWQVMWQDNGHPAFIDPRGGFHFEGRWDGRIRPGNGKGDGRPRTGREKRSEAEEDEGALHGTGGSAEARGAAHVSAETFPGKAANGGPGPRARAGSPRGQAPLQALLDETHRRGVHPDAWTGSARWKREADIPREVFLPAIEAIGESGG